MDDYRDYVDDETSGRKTYYDFVVVRHADGTCTVARSLNSGLTDYEAVADTANTRDANDVVKALRLMESQK